MTTEASAPPARRVRWPVNRNFTLLWCGQSISELGNFLFNTTLVLYIATTLAGNQPWAPLAVSGLLLMQIGPMFLLRPFAGVFVDRWEKRRTMLWADAIRAALVVALLLISSAAPWQLALHLPGTWQLGTLYGGVLLMSVAAQFFSPAQFALLGDLVPELQRPQASGLDLMTSNLAMLLGPAIAGPLFFARGIGWALVINALSFLISWFTILLIQAPASEQRAPDAPRRQFLREFGAGFRLFIRHPELRVTAFSLAIAMFGLGALNTLDVFFVTRNLRAPASLYGLLGAAFSIGSIAGAAIGARLVPRLGLGRSFGLSMLAVGALVLLFARMTSFAPALAVFCLLGIPNEINNVSSGPLVLKVTPREFAGRIISLLTPAWSSAFFLSIFLTGSLSSTFLQHLHSTILGISFGPVDTLLTCTGLLVIAAGIYALLGLRSAEK